MGEHIYPAQQPAPASAAPAPNESAERTVHISGKTFHTHWTSVWGHLPGPPYTPDPMAFTQTWVGDEVPGGLVVMRVQSYSLVPTVAGPKLQHQVSVTIYEAVEGVEPRLGGGATSQPAAAGQPTAKGARVTPPAQRPAPAPVAAGSTQGEKFRAVVSRVRLAKVGLARLGLTVLQAKQTTAGKDVPDDVLDARDRLDAEMKAVMITMRDAAKFDENVKTVQETLDVLEEFLKK